MASLVKQSSTQLALKFFLTASSDHITGLTGATPTVTIRKEGGSFASAAGAVTEIANGWYQVAGNATDTATLGDILLHATAASADPCDVVAACVVGFDPQAALATPTNITAGTITTVTNLTNAPTSGDLTATMKTSVTTAATAATPTAAAVTAAITLPTIPTNWIAATGIAASALNGKGDWNIGKTGYSLTVTPPTAATIASAVWQDTTAGDFTTALSVGKSVMNGVSLGTGLTINGYTGNTPQTGDAYARLGTPAGASIEADIAAVKTDTAAVKVQTDKLAFTVANKVDANVLALNGDATAAANLAAADRAVCRGTVGAAATTSSITTSAFAPGVGAAGQFIGRTVLFDATTSTVALQGQATNITASTNSATPTLTVTALTTAPSAGDTFSIV